MTKWIAMTSLLVVLLSSEAVRSQTLGQALADDTMEQIRRGATVHEGQFPGSMVFQYKDHYEECLGLACAVNPGQWQRYEILDKPPLANSGR